MKLTKNFRGISKDLTIMNLTIDVESEDTIEEIISVLRANKHSLKNFLNSRIDLYMSR